MGQCERRFQPGMSAWHFVMVSASLRSHRFFADVRIGARVRDDEAKHVLIPNPDRYGRSRHEYQLTEGVVVVLFSQHFPWLDCVEAGDRAAFLSLFLARIVQVKYRP